VKKLVFNFSNGTSADLHVCRGIDEFVADPESHYRLADIAFSVDTKTFADLYLNATTLEEAAKSGG